MKVWELMAELARHPAGNEVKAERWDEDGNLRLSATFSGVSEPTNDEDPCVFLGDDADSSLIALAKTTTTD